MSSENTAHMPARRRRSDRTSHRAPVDDELRQLEQRNRELSILNSIASALNQSINLGEALQQTLASTADLLGLTTGWIWLMGEETDEPYMAASRNLPPALNRNPRRMEGRCYCLDTYEAGDMEGAANVNVVTCSRLKGLIDGTNGLRYHASIPLYAHSKRLGVLNVASPEWRELSPDDLRLLHTVGDLLSIAIERARLYDHSARVGAEHERNRLAREIHDTLAQGLAAIALQLESADALLDRPDATDRAQRAVERALDLARANLEEARRSVLDLRAAPLEGRSLPEALEALVAAQHSTSPRAVLTVIGGRHPLPVRVEVGVYRIVQEALSNVAQHAAARWTSVRLVINPTEVSCVIEDDGRGFDAGTVPGQRFGLLGMRERVKALDGTLDVASAPGGGTRITAVIPLGGSE